MNPLFLCSLLFSEKINCEIGCHCDEKIPEIGNRLPASANCCKNPVPSYFFIDSVPAHPYKNRFSDNVIERNKAPGPGIFTVVPVVPHHPVIVHQECVFSNRFSIEKNFCSAY